MKSRLHLASFFFCCSASWALAFMQPAGSPLPDFDKRAGAASAPEAASQEQQRQVEQLHARQPHAQVEFDHITGSPKSVWAGSGFLSGSNGRGETIPVATASRFAVNDPDRATRAFLLEYRDLFRHGPEVLDQARVKQQSVMPHNGLRTVIWQQEVDSIPVFEAVLISHTSRRGELVNISSRFLPDATGAVQRGGQNRANLGASLNVSARRAVAIAAGQIGEQLSEEQVGTNGVSRSGPSVPGPERRQAFRASALRGDAETKLVWLPMNTAQLRLCWDVILTSRTRGEMFRVLVDARTGESLLRRCLTEYISDATYRVFTSDSPSPFSPGYSAPSSEQPPLVSRTLLTISALDTNASPNGWIDDGVNETRGNNADAHTDLNADDQPDLPRPQGSPFRVFDFSLNLSNAPSTYQDAAVVQLFYWCNWMHDQLYDLGFTEAAGNFQNDNLGRGGFGNDAVQADAQDGSGVNNANFSTPPDGTPGRMQMYVYDGPTPAHDADLDAEIILHEYTHGLSNRRVGGGVGISALQTEGMGEGWSDFYALSLLSQPGDDVDGVYAFGAYATHRFFGLTQNYYFGIRRYPYCTDLGKNPLTFKDIDPTQAGSHAGIPRNPAIGTSASAVHNMGEVWCVTLWEARASLIRKHGWTAGNRLILELVTDAMALSPPNPNYLQARDAILQADLLDTAGANQFELWSAFAKRGMGVRAVCPPSSTSFGVVESFELPNGMLPQVLFFSLDTQPAWSLQGEWNFGKPAGLGGTHYGNPDPATAATGTNVFGVNLNGDHSLGIGGPAYLTAGPFDFSGYTGMRLHFQRWLNTDFQQFVFATIEVSSNGANWSPVWDNGTSEIADQAWTSASYDISASADNQTNVYVRWGHHVASSLAFAYSGWNLDDIGFEGNPSQQLTVSIPPAANAGAGTLAGTVVASPASAADLTVALTSSDASAVTVPASVTIPAGQSNVVFSLTIADQLPGRGMQTVLIRATAPNYVAGSSNIVVLDSAAVTLQLSLPGTAIEGEGTLQGAVYVRDVQTNTLIVQLSSSDTTALQVPASIFIPVGQTTAVFTATVIDDSLIEGTQVAVVTAHVPGWIDATGSVLVLDNESLNLTVTMLATAWENSGPLLNAGSVFISGGLKTNLTLLLTSSEPGRLSVPASVTIPAGQVSNTFGLSPVDDAIANSNRTITVQAGASGFSNGIASITVLDDETPPSPSHPSPADLATNVAQAVGLAWQSGSLPGETITNEVFFGTNPIPGAGEFAGSTTNQNWTLPVLAPHTKYYWQIVARRVGIAQGPVWQFTTRGVDHFVWNLIASPQFTNSPFAATITAADADGNAVAGFNGTVALSGASGTGDVAVIRCLPTVSGVFTNGIWSGEITLLDRGKNVLLKADDGSGHAGFSAPFEVAAFNMPATVVSPPTNQVVASGAAVMFSVVADGTPPLSYQWSFNATNLLDATNSLLVITNVQLSDAGNYAVQVTNAFGSAASSNAVLIVGEPSRIVAQPTNEVVRLGETAAFAVGATGTAPLQYQWSYGGTNLVDATNSLLVITNVQLSDAGSYAMRVANAFGSENSSNALLTIGVPPGIAVQPTNLSISVGAVASFITVASGTAPLSYQWSFNATNLLDATNSLLVITNVQLSAAGNYAVQVTSAFGSVESSNAVLEVHVPPPLCTMAPAGLVGWWAAESNALNSAAGHHGSLTNGVAFGPGKVGTAFLFDGGTNAVNLGDPENLKLTNSLSIEAWIWITSPPPTPQGQGQIFFRGDSRPCLDPYFLSVQPGGALRFHVADALDTSACGVNLDSSAVATQQWVHVAAVLNAVQGTMEVYVDGQLVAQTNTAVRPFGNLVGGGVAIGNRSAGDNSEPFAGLIDELAVYDRALAANEIQFIFNSGSSGKCPLPPSWLIQPTNQTVNSGLAAVFQSVATGTPPLNYQWQFNGTNLAGATNSVLAITNAQLSDAGGYAVQVSNAAGSTNSSNALLTIVLAPAFVAQPTNQVVNLGDTATLAAVAVGTTPLHWQWSFNGTNLQFATNGILVITNAQLSDAGAYAVQVSNAFGFKQSTNALLSVSMPPVILVQPTNQILVAGGIARFAVAAAGSSPLNYQWRHSGTNLADDGRMMGASSSELIISNLAQGDIGLYSVAVSNRSGVVLSSNATLLVYVIDHFAWDPIPSPKFANVPFPVRIQALDATNRLLTNFTGSVVLTSTSGVAVLPPVSGSFVLGEWIGSVSVTQSGTGTVLVATDGSGHLGYANPINVNGVPSLSVAHARGFLLISWPADALGFSLETSPDLSEWTSVTAPKALIGDTYEIPLRMSATNSFYRLRFVGP